MTEERTPAAPSDPGARPASGPEAHADTVLEPVRPDGTTGPVPEARPASPPLPARLGEYVLERELARGGMGVVWVARHEALGRRVALKVLQGDGPEQRERFAIEARAAARLRHPHVVGIHHVGEEGPRAYLVMDLIEGRSLAERLAAEGPLPSREAARLAARLAEALAYAHGRGVLHRDVKPSNVLLGPDGEPVLTDFGLAKEVDAGPGGGPTRTGQVMGTPAYMPPEQAAGHADRVDRRADVYALGATLYAMLTGRPPFQGAGALAVLHQVLGQPPVPPRRLRPEVDRALETVCLTCLRKEPERRYASAQALAEDLGRWLRDEPIQARRPSPWERAAQWTRRNRATARLLGAVVAAALGVIAAGTALFVREVEARRARAEAAEEETGHERDTARRAEGEARAAEADARAAADEARAAEEQARRLLGRALEERARAEVERRAWQRAAVLCAEALGREDLPERRLLALTALQAAWPAGRLPAPARVAAWSPDGARLVTGGDDGRVRVWDAARGVERLAVEAHALPVRAVAWSPDGAWLASAADDLSVRLWDAASGAPGPVLLGPSQPVRRLAWSSRGPLAGAVGTAVWLWSGESGAGRELVGHTQPVATLAWSASGRWLATAGHDGWARVWDAAGEPVAACAHPGEVLALAWSPRERAPGEPAAGAATLATGGGDRVARLWDAVSGRLRRRLEGHAGGVTALAWSHDGARLVTGVAEPHDRTQAALRVWDADGGALLATHAGAEDGVRRLDASRAGRLASVSAAGTLEVWDPSRGLLARLHGHQDGVEAADWSPDGARLLSVGGGAAIVWGPHGEPVRDLPDVPYGLAWSPGAARLLAGTLDGRLSQWDPRSGLGRVLEGAAPLTGLALAPGGQRLATIVERAVELWDLEAGRVVARLEHEAVVDAVAWAPDGRRLATVDRAPGGQVWDAASGRREAVFVVAAPVPLDGLRWSPAGDQVALVGRSVQVFPVGPGGDAAAGGPPLEPALELGGLPALAVAWSPDGARLASVHDDGVVRVWDAVRGTHVRDGPRATTGRLPGAAALDWSRDGAWLALATDAPEVVLLDAEAEPRARLAGHAHAVLVVAWSPDGRLATGSADRSVRVWEPALLDLPVEALGRRAAALTGLAVDGLDVVPLAPAQAPVPAPDAEPRPLGGVLTEVLAAGRAGAPAQAWFAREGEVWGLELGADEHGGWALERRFAAAGCGFARLGLSPRGAVVGLLEGDGPTPGAVRPRRVGARQADALLACAPGQAPARVPCPPDAVPLAVALFVLPAVAPPPAGAPRELALLGPDGARAARLAAREPGPGGASAFELAGDEGPPWTIRLSPRGLVDEVRRGAEPPWRRVSHDEAQDLARGLLAEADAQAAAAAGPARGAIKALLAVALAQALAREAAPAGEYAPDLAALEDLVARGALSGAKVPAPQEGGYRFRVRRDPAAPGAAWLAVAEPVEPGAGPWLAVDARAVVHALDGPVPADAACRVPAGARPCVVWP